ncbi:glycosyltransferase family 9 protein [Dactylosporangium aurantiacum]|uniref:glycosyltransferase family 9 protein n=1 Tax=Dactylosporangium aurantiacum TaxID=35754 RepID=UPI001FE0A423|nr:glycosyltransferase family 9 protein [Dactylosporangium aurantiacum]MDG6103797.1 glycosyltransferase family 9 protein [Dactylosporangium aurantiacum]
MSRSPGLLVLRALGIGDLATAVPALRGLRAAFPRHRLTLAAPAWLAPLVDLVEAVDAQLPVEDLTPRTWDGPPPELAVNLHGRGPQSHRLLRAAAPGRLLAFACPPAGHHDGPHWCDDEHEVDRWCRLLHWYGIPADRTDLDLAPPGHPAPVGVSVVHPGAKSGRRRWPVDRFAAVARQLAADGHQVVLTGGPGEEAAAHAVATAAGLDRSAVLAGRTGLGELAAVIARARLLVSGDTGVAHLATAFRTPSVVLFGPMSPQRWGPPATRPWHRAIWHGTVAEPGDTPGREPHPALLRVTPGEVLAAVSAVLSTATVH